MNAEIVKDVGGTALLDTPQLGRPSSATVTVFNPDGTTLVASGSATIDSVNTTISSGAAAGDTSLPLTSASGVAVGRYYVLSGADGREEWVRVAAISGTTATLYEDIGYTYSSGAAFLGTRISKAISAANAATLEEGYICSWVYTTDGVEHRVNAFFDVVRSKWADVIIAPHDFKLRAGDMAMSEFEANDAAGLDFSDDISHGTELIRVEVGSRGYRPALFLSPGETFKDAICQRVLLTWAERGQSVPATWQDDVLGWVELRREVYEQTLNNALNTANFDENQDQVVTKKERSMRLGSVRITL